jgi:RimJ/RimL family protein N-acetyltransferase
MLQVPPICSPRLRLVSLSPAFLRASLDGRLGQAERLIEARLPADWPAGNEPVLRRRLAQLEANPGEQPWLLRAMVLDQAAARGPSEVRVPGTMIGRIGFHGPPDARAALEVGYAVEPAYRRQGYAEEAVRALLDWATREHDIQHFVASVSPTNQPSLRLVKKLGFQMTGEQWDEVDGLELVFEWQPARPYTPDDRP